jgi:hypothetical protein
MRLAIVVVVAVGCAAPTPYRRDVEGTLARYADSQVADATLTSTTWQVGRWAWYQHVYDGELGIDHFAVIGTDACGVWVRHTSESYRHVYDETVCFRGGGELPRDAHEAYTRIAMIILDEDGRRMSVIDARKRRLGSRGPEIERWAWSLVPTQWSHDNGRLLVTGDDGAESLAATLATRVAARENVPPPRLFGGLSVGYGALTRHGREDITPAISIGSVFGGRIEDDLDAILIGGGTMASLYSPDPASSLGTVELLAGVRWRPDLLRADRFPIEPYLQGAAGFTELDVDSATSRVVEAKGLGIDLTVGVISGNARGWATTFALGDTIGVYGSGEGTRHVLSARLGLQLYMW